MDRTYRNHIHAYADAGPQLGSLPAAFRTAQGTCPLEKDVWLTRPLAAHTSVPSVAELPMDLRRVVCLGLWGGLPGLVDSAQHESASESDWQAVLTFDSLVGPPLLWTQAVSKQFPDLLFEHHFHGHHTPECGLTAFRRGDVVGQVRLPESAVRLQKLAEASSAPNRHDEEIDDLVQTLMDWAGDAWDRT